MNDERKPSDDLKEGLGLLFRAARTAAKQVDVSKIDKSLDKAVSKATRVASTVSRAVADEINRMSSTKQPPWQSKKPETETQDPGDTADKEPKADNGEGRVWASEAQQSEAEESTEPEATKKPD